MNYFVLGPIHSGLILIVFANTKVGVAVNTDQIRFPMFSLFYRRFACYQFSFYSSSIVISNRSFGIPSVVAINICCTIVLFKFNNALVV